MSISEPQDRRQRGENRWRRFLRAYRFEIIWGAIVVLGLFLILERFNIRQASVRWFRALVDAGKGSLDRLDSAILRFLATTSLSDIIGFVLIAGALAAIVLRMRWRLIHSTKLTALRCPKCSSDIHRVHRRWLDHIVSIFVPVRRFRCSNRACRWHGLRIGTGHHTGQRTAARATTR